MADTVVANPSMERRFLISIISRLKPHVDRAACGLGDLCAVLPIVLWALSDAIVRL